MTIFGEFIMVTELGVIAIAVSYIAGLLVMILELIRGLARKQP